MVSSSNFIMWPSVWGGISIYNSCAIQNCRFILRMTDLRRKSVIRLLYPILNHFINKNMYVSHREPQRKPTTPQTFVIVDSWTGNIEGFGWESALVGVGRWITANHKGIPQRRYRHVLQLQHTLICTEMLTWNFKNHLQKPSKKGSCNARNHSKVWFSETLRYKEPTRRAGHDFSIFFWNSGLQSGPLGRTFLWLFWWRFEAPIHKRLWAALPCDSWHFLNEKWHR